MIKFSYQKNEVNYKLKVIGHASNNHGQDIICSSVSTAIIVSINLIEELKLSSKINYTLSDGYFNLEVVENDYVIIGVLNNLIYTLEDLSSQYPKRFRKEIWC